MWSSSDWLAYPAWNTWIGRETRPILTSVTVLRRAGDAEITSAQIDLCLDSDRDRGWRQIPRECEVGDLLPSFLSKDEMGSAGELLVGGNGG